ncbi:MAG: hypothetical protein AB1758_19400 [Candidatus Eremiobacterota bacterium]
MLSEHPLIALLEMRDRRRRRVPAGLWLICLAVPMLLLLALPGGDHPSVRLLAALLLASSYPLAEAARGASVLGGLRKGGALDELTATLTRPSELVDGLAWHTARTVLGSWRWAAPLWVLGGLTLAGLPWWQALLLPVAGLPLQAALAMVGSHVALAGQAWSTGEDDLVPRSALMAGVLLPTAAASLAAGPAAWLLAALPWRGLARLGLTHSDVVRRRASDLWTALSGVDLNRWALLPGSSNPVVFRESHAEARRIPGGLVTLALWRHGPALLVLSATAVATGLEPSLTVVWTALVVLLLVETLQAAYRTVGAVVVEREANTLETLLSTPLSARRWVDGWGAVGFLPRVLDVALACPVLLAASMACPVAPPGLAFRSGTALLTVLALAVAAAYTGVQASSRSAGRAEAHDRLGLELFVRLWAIGVGGLLVALVAPLAVAWTAAPVSAGLAWWQRRQCLQRLALDASVLPPAVAELLYRCLRVAAPPEFARRLLARLEAAGLVAPPLGPVLSLGLHRRAPAGFKERLLGRWEE